MDNKYRTRKVSEGKLVEPSVRNYYGKKCTKYLTPKFFNEIDWLRQGKLACKLKVKKKLKNYFLGKKEDT